VEGPTYEVRKWADDSLVAMTPYASITVAFDGSDSAVLAATTAGWIAEKFRSKVTLLAVAPATPRPNRGSPASELPDGEAIAHELQNALDGEKARLEKTGLPQVRTKLLRGSIVEALLEHLEAEPPDLLVVGARGLSRTARIFLGSVSDGMVHHAHCPVLVVKPPSVN
jgi:nucleotide-binding universal stress UspA family protein